MRKSHTVLKKAVDQVGAKAVANTLKLSPSLIYKWCQDPKPVYTYKSASGSSNPLDRISKIYEATQEPEIIQWVCQIADGYFVRNVEGHDLKEKDALKNIQQFIKEFSETLDTISESYANDGRITQKEAQRIRSQWEDLKRLGEGFVAACESGQFSQGKKK